MVVRADRAGVTRFRAEAVRDRHLERFHVLAMAEGLKVAGSLGVGLRLRHDCSNITTAFEWAADHDRWIMAGELLTGSQCAYQLEGRMIDLRGCQRASTITAVSVPLDRMGPQRAS